MRVRSQRTHLMGSSNRSNDTCFQKSISVYERSLNKSSLLPSKLQQTSTAMKSSLLKSQTFDDNTPFKGSNTQLESYRFDISKIRPYIISQQRYHLKPVVDYSSKKNTNISKLKEQFQNTSLNTHKLYLFKQTILKNNRQKRDFNKYFQKFSQGNNQISLEGMRKFAKQYGYDLSKDQISLLLKLNSGQYKSPIDKHNHNQQTNDNTKNQQVNSKIKVELPEFINLCTKNSIYYKTIDLKNDKDYKKQLIPSHFQIFRNKFTKLKQAFNIYRQRNQPINFEKFTSTMKKLDINDLVIKKPQRDQIFYKFRDQTNHFNLERFLSSLATQHNHQYQQKRVKSGFQDNLDFIAEQKQQKQKNKTTNYNLKKSSIIQYERHLQKIRPILNKIRQLSKCPTQKETLLHKLISNHRSNKLEVQKNLKIYLLQKGLNYPTQNYNSLISFIDFDTNQQIDKTKLQYFLLNQDQKASFNRIQRQTRNLRPLLGKHNFCQYDQVRASQQLQALKSTIINPEVSKLFLRLDKDKDGFISKQQFFNQIKDIMPSQNAENINNLVNYFYEQKNGLTRNQFRLKFNKEEPSFDRKKSKSVSDCFNIKKSQTKKLKQISYQRPTQFSAWPSYLHNHDLSLLQPNSKSGIYINEKQRFKKQQKHDYGRQEKLVKHRLQQRKIQKLQFWNNSIKQKNQLFTQLQQKKCQQKNFSIRLAKQQYQQNIKNYPFS